MARPKPAHDQPVRATPAMATTWTPQNGRLCGRSASLMGGRLGERRSAPRHVAGTVVSALTVPPSPTRMPPVRRLPLLVCTLAAGCGVEPGHAPVARIAAEPRAIPEQD